MGAVVGLRCFSDAAAASTAVWSDFKPLVEVGPPTKVVSAEPGSGGWVFVTRLDGVVQSVQPVPSLAFAECDPASFVADGVELGFLVLGVWAAVFAVLVVRRALR